MSRTETTKPIPTKPLIFASDPFEGMDEHLGSFQGGQWDVFYIPNYSELRSNNELRVRDGLAPVPLDRLQWVRISKGNKDVSETDEAMYQWRRLGYRAIGTAYLTEKGYGFPPNAYLAPDGTIRIGDVALFMVPERQAEINRAEDAAVRQDRAHRPALQSQDGLEIVQDIRHEEKNRTLKEVYESPLPRL